MANSLPPNRALLLTSQAQSAGIVAALRNSKVKFKSQDVIFKTVLLVPNQEVTGYSPEITLLEMLPWGDIAQWRPLWTGSKVWGVNHPTLISLCFLNTCNRANTIYVLVYELLVITKEITYASC